MQAHGFIQDMLDVKVLILFVAARAQYPLELQKLYELCYQDDKLSYFDICVAVPELVASGHLEQSGTGQYVITEKGRRNEELTADGIAFPVRQRALAAVERFNREAHRSSLVRTQILPRKNGDFSVVMALDDEVGNLMTLELMAPTQKQARALERAFGNSAEQLFQMIMTELLDEAEQKHDADV